MVLLFDKTGQSRAGSAGHRRIGHFAKVSLTTLRPAAKRTGLLAIDADFRQLRKDNLYVKNGVDVKYHQRRVLLTGEPSLLSS